MKTLICIFMSLISVAVFSQNQLDTIKISKEVQEIAIQVAKKRQTVDSIKELKSKEIEKQLKIIALIKQTIEELKNQKKIKHLDTKVIFDTIEGIKRDTDPEYWEVIPRKWTGRLFHKDDYIIKKYKYINNEKVYIN